MGVLVRRKIKHLIFSVLLHQYLVAPSASCELQGLKACYVKTSLFEFATFQCHCLDSGLRKKENKKKGLGINNSICLLHLFLCHTQNEKFALTEVEKYCQLSSISHNFFSIKISIFHCWILNPSVETPL